MAQNPTHRRWRYVSNYVPNNFVPNNLMSFTPVVALPYATHTAKWNELYSLGIPMLFPSKDLLLRCSESAVTVFKDMWMTETQLLERDSCGQFWPDALRNFEDNNNTESWRENLNLDIWLSLSDFYTWPHITYFESFEEVEGIVDDIVSNPTRLLAIRRGMNTFWNELIERTKEKVQTKLAQQLRDIR
jgi:hypothetical protein